MPETLEAPDDAQMQKPEKYSVQCLRQIHEDMQIILHEYDEMLQLCDHPQIGKYIENIIMRSVSDLEKLEDLMEKFHPGITLGEEVLEEEDPALQDAEVSPDDIVDSEATLEQEGDTDSVPADSRLENLPSEEEALEGMKRGLKTLDPKKMKSLRQKHKGMCAKCGQAQCKCYDGKSFEEQKKRGIEDAVGEGNDDLVAPEPDSISNYFGDFEPQVREAHDFLGELSNTTAFDDHSRQKSFHYHKVLESIVGAQSKKKEKGLPAGVKGGDKDPRPTPYQMQTENSHVDPTPHNRAAEQKPHSQPVYEIEPPRQTYRYGDKDMSDPSMGTQSNSSGSYTPDASAGFVNNPMTPGVKELAPHHKACHEASAYLGKMSRERAYGEPHRQEAKYHFDSLYPFLQSIDEANINTGGTGQKSLLDSLDAQLYELKALDKRLDSLLSLA